MRMKEKYKDRWHDVCVNCAFADFTQTHSHCCERHINSKLVNLGDCNDFIYERTDYCTRYGEERLSENDIRRMTEDNEPKETTVLISGDVKGNVSGFYANMQPDGTLIISAHDEYEIILDRVGMRYLYLFTQEAMERKWKNR